ncbi:hypothetical protein AVEN_35689-1, partial [Araneus ventricosus]
MISEPKLFGLLSHNKSYSSTWRRSFTIQQKKSQTKHGQEEKIGSFRCKYLEAPEVNREHQHFSAKDYVPPIGLSGRNLIHTPNRHKKRCMGDPLYL